MAMRKLLLGAFGVLATGAALAAPPEDPRVAGREPNPVAREFYQDEPAPFEYVGPAAEAAESGDTMWDLLMDRLTVPLGTAPVWD